MIDFIKNNIFSFISIFISILSLCITLFNLYINRKKLDVVIEKGAVVGGGSDVTDDLIAKMGKASDDQIKEAENAAKAQEQQDAQQNAQQAGQTTAVNTEESAQ